MNYCLCVACPCQKRNVDVQYLNIDSHPATGCANPPTAAAHHHGTVTVETGTSVRSAARGRAKLPSSRAAMAIRCVKSYGIHLISASAKSFLASSATFVRCREHTTVGTETELHDGGKRQRAISFQPSYKKCQPALFA